MNIRTLTAADLPFAMRLKAQNHWNQLEADWRRQLELEPTGCFLAEQAGQPAGTACACVFGDVAWINLVLVDQAQRGQGIGTALMRHVIQYLDERGVATQRLDATPLGQPVYEKLGFVGDFGLARFAGVLPQVPEQDGIAPLAAQDVAAACALDTAVTKTQRDRLLRRLHGEDPLAMRACLLGDRLAGFGGSRPGANAWHIGPLIGSLQAGELLLRDAAHRFAGRRVYIDVPTDNAHAVLLVRELGLEPQRPFLRMSRGRRVEEDVQRLWASFGPEKG